MTPPPAACPTPNPAPLYPSGVRPIVAPAPFPQATPTRAPANVPQNNTSYVPIAAVAVSVIVVIICLAFVAQQALRSKETTIATATSTPAASPAPSQAPASAPPTPVAVSSNAEPSLIPTVATKPGSSLVTPPSPVPPEADLTTEQIASRSEASVALIKGAMGSGSGFLVLPGILATNAHVVRNEFDRNLEVHFPSARESADKRPLKTELVYKSEKRDLAFLTVQSRLEPLTVADKFQFHKGAAVSIIGSPGFGGSVLENANCTGTLSTRMTMDGQDFFQLNTSINPGNSGGPVFSSKGQVIGVATLRAAKQEALGFCIPVEDLRSAISQIRTQSPETAAVNRQRHRHQVVCRLLTVLAREFAKGLDAYIAGMVEAVNAGKEAKIGLNKAAQVVDQRLKRIEDGLYSYGLKDEMRELSASETTDRELREEFLALWNTFKQEKDLLDNARGTVKSFADEVAKFEADLARQVENLQLRLGISDDD
jgi:serine protease Do